VKIVYRSEAMKVMPSGLVQLFRVKRLTHWVGAVPGLPNLPELFL